MPNPNYSLSCTNNVGLLDLPSEVRLQIYQHLFNDCPAFVSIRVFTSSTSSTRKNHYVRSQQYSPGQSGLNRAIVRPFDPPWLPSNTSSKSTNYCVNGEKDYLGQSRLNSTFRLFGPHRSRPWILLTCRTIYREAWNIFVSNIELHYGIPATISDDNCLDPNQRKGLNWDHQDATSRSQSNSSSACQTQLEGKTDIWTKHVSHGSNIVLFTSDCAKIRQVYDNIQISYTPGFKSELLRAVPNVQILTVRRNWDPKSGKFSGKEQEIDLHVEYEDVTRKELELELFDITNNGPAPPPINLSEIRKAVETQIKQIRLEDSEERQKRPVWTDKNKDHNSKWKRLLTQDHKQRGFKVHMEITTRLLIDNMKLSPHSISNPNLTNNSHTNTNIIDPGFKPNWTEKWNWSPTPNSMSGSDTTTTTTTTIKPISETDIGIRTEAAVTNNNWTKLKTGFYRWELPRFEDHEFQRQSRLKTTRQDALVDVGTVHIARIDVRYDWDSGEIVNFICTPVPLRFMTQV